jgi:hypothetical protein
MIEKIKIKRAYGILLIIVFFIFSCNKEKTHINTDQVISCEISDSIIPADGLSSILITAMIDQNATERNVLFSTNLGTFRNNQTVKKDSTIKANNDGIASLSLFSGKVPGIVNINVSINDEQFSVERIIRILSLEEFYKHQKLVITLSDTAIKATNAQTFCLITALLENGPNSGIITFKTTRGSFLNAIQDSGRSYQVNADLNGLSHARLLSSTKPGLAFISIICGQTQVDTVIRFVP